MAPDDRNPLARALDEAANGPEARAFSVSVDAVHAGVRRRRARRTGVTSGLAMLVIAAIAGGAYAGTPGWGGASRLGNGPLLPGPAATSAALADWPAQFERCGRTVNDTLPPVGGDVNLAINGEPASVAADGTWDASVVIDVPSAPPGASAVVWGIDLSVVKGAVVVGVQDGAGTPDLSWPLTERLGGDALPTSPFPVTTKVSQALVSCSQYPNAQGSPNLAPGTYQLVVTETLSYATQPVGDLTDVRRSVISTVTITPPGRPTTADPTACGASADKIAALVSPASNAAPITLSIGIHPTPSSYSYYPVGPRLTNTGTAALIGVTSEPTVVAVRDGVVVGRAQRSGVRTDLGRLVPGGAFDYADPPFAERCPGTPEPAWEGGGLAAGDYELWVVVDVVAADSPDTTWQAAAGPIPWTVTNPTAETPAPDPVDALFPCGKHAAVTTETLPDVTPLRLTATIPRDGWADGVNVPDWSALLSASDGATVRADVNRFVYLAFVDDHGIVVGRTVSGDGVAIETATIGGGLTYMQTGYGFPVACAPDGSLGAAGTYATIAPGTYTARPFAVVTVDAVSGLNLPSDVTAFRGDTIVVGDGIPVTFTGPPDAAAADAAIDAVFRCDEPVHTSSAAARTGLTLDAPAPGGTWGWVPPRWPMTLATGDHATPDFWLVTQPQVALLDQKGRYVGVAMISSSTGNDAAGPFAGGPGVSVRLADSSRWTTYGCILGMAQLAGAEEGFKGPHRAVPYVVVDLGQGPVVVLGATVDAPFASPDAIIGA